MRTSADTSPAASALMIAGLRRMTGAQRLSRALMLSRLAAELALADIRRRHPHESEREWRARLAKRRIDDSAVHRELLDRLISGDTP